MINVNQITATLAKLPDQALQRYAMMHKDDPYIMSLALAESNRRKDIRAGAQMQPQQQPKVADQAIASMAAPMPENVGIGQLPAGNMNFAGGGIVAFADGGETDDMYPYGESVLRMADGGVPRYNGTTGSQIVYPGMLPMEGGTILPTTTGYEGLSMLEFLERFGGDVGKKLKKLIRSEEENAARMYGGKTADIFEANRKRGNDPFGYSQEDYPMPVSTAPTVYSGAGNAPSQQTPPPPPPSLERRPPAAAPGAGTAMPTTPEGVAALYKNMRGQFGEGMPDSQRAELEDITRTAKEQAEERRNRLELQQAARGQFGEDQERRLKAREERINKEESNLFGTSLFQAGLAIMGGSSPHGLVNIAAGAQVGLKNYQAGIDKLSIARDKLDDAFGRLEEIRRNESRMNEKELNAAEDEVQKAILQGKKDLYTANHDYFKMSREDANKAADAYLGVLKTQYEQGEQTKRTNIMAAAQQANNPLATAMALGTAEPGSPLLKGYNILKQEQQLPMLYKAYIDAITDPIKGADIKRQYPDFKTYLEGMAMGSAGGAGGAGGGSPLIRSR